MTATSASNSWANVQSQSTFLSMIDFAIPGTMYSALPGFLTGQLDIYAPLMFIIGLFVAVKAYTLQARAWFYEYCTTTVSMKDSDEAYDIVCAWTSVKRLNKTARSRIARVGKAQSIGEQVSNGSQRPLRVAPWYGSFLFWYHGQLLFYQSGSVSSGMQKEDLISITCIGRSGNILNEFLKDCHQEYERQDRERTIIFKHRNDYWRRTSSIAKRRLSTVIDAEQPKRKFVDDVREFLDLNTRTWYSSRGIPYRRGYLLYGPPGTGKSSLSAAVAGEFGLDVYVVDIPSTNDHDLAELFGRLPENCLVLLEDIDAVETSRSQDNSTPHERRRPVSLSGLLNTLDGIASQEGQIVIMTTNHIERLDPALIRPGRIDLKMELSHADAAMTSKLFQFIYEPTEKSCPGKSKEQLQLEEFSSKFAVKVPEHQFSTAQIMSYLLQHKDSPTTALANAEEWVRNMFLEQETDDQAGEPRENVPNTSYDTATSNEDVICACGIRHIVRNSEDLLSAGCILPPLSLQKFGYRPNTPRSDVEENDCPSHDEGVWLKRVERYDRDLCTMGQSRQGPIEPLLPGPGEPVQRWTALAAHPIDTRPYAHGTELKGTLLTEPNPTAYPNSGGSQEPWQYAVLSPPGEWNRPLPRRWSLSDSFSVIDSTFGHFDLVLDSTDASWERIPVFDPSLETQMQFNQVPVGAEQCVDAQAQTAEPLVDAFANDADAAHRRYIAVLTSSRAASSGLPGSKLEHADPEAYAPLLRKTGRGALSDLSGSPALLGDDIIRRPSGVERQQLSRGSSSNPAGSMRSRFDKNNGTRDMAGAPGIEIEAQGPAEIPTKFNPFPHNSMNPALYGAQPPHDDEADAEEQFLRAVEGAVEQGFVDIEDVFDKTGRAPDPNIMELKVPREAQPKLDQHSQIKPEAALEKAQNGLTNGKRALSNSHTYSHSCGNLAPLNGLQTAANSGTSLRTPSRPHDQRSRSSSPASSSATRQFNEIECAEGILRLASSTTPISEYGNREAGQDVAANAGMQLIPWPSQEELSSDTVGSLAPTEDTSLRQPSGWAQPQQRRSSSLDSTSLTRSTFDQVDSDQDSTTTSDWCGNMMPPPSSQTGARGDNAQHTPSSRDSSPAPSGTAESVFDETEDADSTEDPDIAMEGLAIIDATMWHDAIVFTLDELLDLQEITAFPL